MDLQKIKDYLENFGTIRGWDKFKTPKNLSMAMAVEIAELMEIFQWMDGDESLHIKNDERKLQLVKEELADIFSYLIQIASVLDIQIEDAFWEKTKKNEIKYPLINLEDDS